MWIFDTVGLTVFMACVGLAAGPSFFSGLQKSGISLVFVGLVIAVLPHTVSILFGRFVLKMNPVIVLGACSGAGTITAALRAIQEEAQSDLPALGYTVPYAIGNILLTAWGPVLVAMVISATGGIGSAQLNGVGVLDAVLWSFAAGITQPIFFGGELKAIQDIRTAEQKAAAYSYTGTALRVFEDVEDALAGDYYLRKREGALSTAVSSSSEAVKFGRQQFEQGQIDMFIILRLSGENLASKVQLTQIRASRLRERVNLHLALGGDFSGPTDK